jgi:hypothetical protein
MNQTPPKVCLIIAFYFGERTNNNTFHNLIEIQKRILRKYEHKLSDVVFAIAEDNRTDVKIEESTDELGNKITYFYKPNLALSFGSWHTVVNYYKDKYDYYIFGEDDYVFVKPNFDEILVREYDSQNKPYMVNWMHKNGNHLISTIGIISSKELARLNYMNAIVWTNDKDKSMFDFLNLFFYNGGVSCVGAAYSAFPYWGPVNNQWKVWLFGYREGETMINFTNRVLVCAIQGIDKYDNIMQLSHEQILIPN